MPIFEYLCKSCNRIFSFLSLTLVPTREPVCPKCGASGLSRVPSSFAVASTRKSKEGAKRGADSNEPGDSASRGEADDGAMSAMEQEMMQMAEGLDEKDAEDPRVMARMMRRMAEVSGEPVTPTMHEMLRRLESGEDPEHLEEELGPQLEEEMGGESGSGGAPSRDDGLYDF
jgi:putative FmdB family regulatory protein